MNILDELRNKVAITLANLGYHDKELENELIDFIAEKTIEYFLYELDIDPQSIQNEETATQATSYVVNSFSIEDIHKKTMQIAEDVLYTLKEHLQKFNIFSNKDIVQEEYSFEEEINWLESGLNKYKEKREESIAYKSEDSNTSTVIDLLDYARKKQDHINRLDTKKTLKEYTLDEDVLINFD